MLVSRPVPGELAVRQEPALAATSTAAQVVQVVSQAMEAAVVVVPLVLSALALTVVLKVSARVLILPVVAVAAEAAQLDQSARPRAATVATIKREAVRALAAF